jgi:hypothetical protein
MAIWGEFLAGLLHELLHGKAGAESILSPIPHKEDAGEITAGRYRKRS